MRAYLSNARSLLESSARGDNPFEGMTPEVPSGVSLDYGSRAFDDAERAGLAVFRDCACVLVAGGLGERLGYNGIKLSLPVESLTETCYLELYAQQILALQARSNALCGGSARAVPLAIMTSDDTHARTVSLLQTHDNFGLAADQVTILKQEKVAALTDNAAHMALAEGSDPYELDTKPHGHGDVHTLLASSGLARRWAEEGRRYVVFFQDTNALCFGVTVAAIGVSCKEGFEVNSVTVPRKAKDAVGAITRLVRADGSGSITVNVEYNQLEPLLKASGFADGDVNDPATGFSPYPGNINQLVFAVAPYAQVLQRTGGLVPEFVNPKYADASKTKFKKPTRLECMMQDHPKVLGAESRVGFTNFPEWTYLPVKNSIDEARAKIAVGAPGRSAAEGELEYYDSFLRMLEAVGVHAPRPSPPNKLAVFGFQLTEPAHVVLAPSFAPTHAELREKIQQPMTFRLSPTATLVMQGDCSGLTFSGPVDIDGAVRFKLCAGATVEVKRLRALNAGAKLRPLSDSELQTAAPPVRIRGFTVQRDEERLLAYDAPGHYVVEDKE